MLSHAGGAFRLRTPCWRRSGRVVAQSPDGVVEAVEIEAHRFAIGVQWHPEWLYIDHPEMKRLFTALVEASRNGDQRPQYGERRPAGRDDFSTASLYHQNALPWSV